MKAFLAIVGGFVLTLSVFAGGAAFAIFVLGARPAPEPRNGPDLAAVWSSEPKVVDAAAQPLERLPARTPAADVAMAQPRTTVEGADGVAIDRTVTSSLATEDASTEGRDAETAAIAAAHVDWCAERYRSYRPRDDSFTPHGGGRKPCVSPYSEALDAAGGGEARAVRVTFMPAAESEAGEDMPPLGYAPEAGRAAPLAGMAMPAAHVRRCLARYRSYRPEDNTYQPYGGGPRRQCGAAEAPAGYAGRDTARPRFAAGAPVLYATREVRRDAGRRPAGRARFDPHRGGR